MTAAANIRIILALALGAAAAGKPAAAPEEPRPAEWRLTEPGPGEPVADDGDLAAMRGDDMAPVKLFNAGVGLIGSGQHGRAFDAMLKIPYSMLPEHTQLASSFYVAKLLRGLGFPLTAFVLYWRYIGLGRDPVLDERAAENAAAVAKQLGAETWNLLLSDNMMELLARVSVEALEQYSIARAKHLILTGNFDGGLSFLDRYSEYGEPGWEIEYLRGIAYYQKGRRETSFKAFVKALQKDPTGGNAAASLALGRVALSRKDPAGALQYLQAVPPAFEDYDESLLETARVRLLEKDLDAAMGILFRLTRSPGESPDGLIETYELAARVYYERCQYGKALEVLDAGISLFGVPERGASGGNAGQPQCASRIEQIAGKMLPRHAGSYTAILERLGKETASLKERVSRGQPDNVVRKSTAMVERLSAELSADVSSVSSYLLSTAKAEAAEQLGRLLALRVAVREQIKAGLYKEAGGGGAAKSGLLGGGDSFSSLPWRDGDFEGGGAVEDLCGR